MKATEVFRKEFGVWLYLQMKVLKILRKISSGPIKRSLYDFEHAKKKMILEKLLVPCINQFPQEHSSGQGAIPKRIWIFWWQGNQNDIPIVNLCISSIYKRKPIDAELVVLTKDNLYQYCKIPSHIQEKVDTGIITLTHFSDIVRVGVLAEHGGVWLDATVYAATEFSTIFDGNVWSIKKPSMYHKYIPKGRWSIYAIGAEKHSLLFLLMRELFSEYWKTHDSMLDYFLVDYCMDLLYERVPGIRQALDAIPENNPQVLELQRLLGQPFTGELFGTLLADTQLFKLSWKKEVPLEIDGKVTMLGWLLGNG